MKSSTKHQEQSDSHPRQVDTPSNEPVTPWYGWFPYSCLPMDYSRIYMQSYYIQYHPMYPNYALPQKPVVSGMIWSNRILIATKQMRKAQSETQNIYSRSGVLQAYLIPRRESCSVCARRRQWSNK